MEDSFEVKLKKFQNQVCQNHQEPIVQACLNPECKRYFELECFECTQSHPDHSGKFIKSIKQILTASINCFEQLQISSKGSVNNNNQDEINLIESQCKNMKILAKEFFIQSEILKKISDNILNVSEQYRSSQRAPQQCLEQLLEEILGYNNQESLSKIQDLKKFIKFNKEDSTIQYTDYKNNNIDIKTYQEKIKNNLIVLTNSLKKYEKSSQEIEQQNQIYNQIFSSLLKHEQIFLDETQQLVRKIKANTAYDHILSENKISKEKTIEFKIKINKIKTVIGFGIQLKKKAQDRNISGWMGNIGEGFYQFQIFMNKACYKFSNHTNKENLTTFKFDENVCDGDILCLKYDHEKSSLILRNEKNLSQLQQLSIQFLEDDDFHFCISLFTLDDEIIII